MKQSKKKCRGINKAQGFKGCGKETYYRRYGLCPSCLSEWFATENGKVFFQKLILKASKPRLELEKAKRQRKQKNTLEGLKLSLKNVFHEYVRTRDKNKPCISCGEPWHKDFHAGHYFKAELHSSVRFHEDNVHGQCAGCNIFKEGNLSEYTLNLPKRIGAEKYYNLVLIAEKEKQEGFKWDRQKLIELRKYYQQKLKEL